MFAGMLSFVRQLLEGVWVAIGQIWSNKTRSALTTIGLVIGVASVCAVIAGLTGLKTKVLSEFESVANARSIYLMGNRPQEGRLKNAPWEEIVLKPDELDGLLDHCPSVENFTMIRQNSWSVRSGERSVDSIPVTGISRAWHEIEGRSVIMGRPFSLVDSEHARRVCLITPDLRDELRLNRDCIGESLLMGDARYLIVGVVEEKVQPSMFGMMDNSSAKGEAFVPFATMYKASGGGWMHAIVTSKSPEVSADAQAEIRFYMRRARDLKPGDPNTFRMEVVEKFISGFKKVAAVMTAIAGGIVAISLLVGGVGIMNIMLVSVSERTREIGLRKAVGAKASAIMFQFLIEAVILCMLGGLIGIGAGQLLTAGMASMPNGLDEAHIPFWAILLSLAFSGLVGVVFGMFPAVKAARLDPIEALRHE
ncbi:Macrolide export ATP-binding/permease protein MacB [Anaerohalosphaera lusitana]|uniref:Macrolide export ATP-binding/permease protein MacB n=1 Tax=Anaerohalosphaera lusitana TaxID=1936003 RepID=A0A1U9NP38_9BACT|nr:ABC transporter permease [Anaerohalosphaera lusitana]AQT69712.1 Macrolide export ATP-binding/permease protein MacB [Anaerohalosphaera lusitana]